VTNPEIGSTVDLAHYGDLESEDKAGQLADAILSAIELSRLPGGAARCRDWASQWSLDRIGRDEELMLEAIYEER
jgi:hypothetical protein